MECDTQECSCRLLQPEKAMATHSNTLAWRTPGTEEPGGLPSMGSHRVGHNWSDLAAAALQPEVLKGTEEGPRSNPSRVYNKVSTDAEAAAPILWLPDVKNWLLGKDPDAGKDWRQEEKGMTEDEVVGWHHWLSGHEFEQALGVGDGQGNLECCCPWGRKESDMTEQLNWIDPNLTPSICRSCFVLESSAFQMKCKLHHLLILTFII